MHRGLARLFLALVISLTAFQPTWGQVRQASNDLSERAKEKFFLQDHQLALQTRSLPNARVDRSGTLRAAYRIDFRGSVAGRPETTARRFLDHQSVEFGIANNAASLELVEVVRTGVATHVLFRQVYRGVPVHNRFVKVSLDARGAPTMVVSGFAPAVERYRPQVFKPSVSESAAREIAERALAPSVRGGPVSARVANSTLR